MTTHPDIVFISGHGHVYQDEDVRAEIFDWKMHNLIQIY